MPAGLDGNPDPIRSAARDDVLAASADLVLEARRHRAHLVTLVAIDGIDGAGKSTFADELGGVLRPHGVSVIRSTIDSFHRPRVERGIQGRWSPDGFYEDSHNLARLQEVLLDPIAGDPPRPCRLGLFDEPTDRFLSEIEAPFQTVPPGGVLLFDGIFLHRPELRGRWHFSIFLEAWERVNQGRIDSACQSAPNTGPALFHHLSWWWTVLPRYVEGQRRYLTEASPSTTADLAIDNNNLTSPFVLTDRHRTPTVAIR